MRLGAEYFQQFVEYEIDVELNDENIINIIQEKYGEEAIQNPKTTWDDKKEKEYLQQIKKIAKSEHPIEKIEVEGVLMPKKLFTKESKKIMKHVFKLYIQPYYCC